MRFARGVDVLAPEGYGEIVGGGERETNVDSLIEKIHEHQLAHVRIRMVFRSYVALGRFLIRALAWDWSA